MKIKYNFYSPLLMALLASCCLWVVTDMAYGVRIWEINAQAWIERIEALIINIVGFVISYLFFTYLASSYFDKDECLKPRPKLMEYLLVIPFTIVILNVGLYIVITYINVEPYRWGEGLLTNAAAIPISLLYYTIIRNNILVERYAEKMIQLKQMKVERLETELKLLRSQFHPHFLFNALNTIYFQIEEKNEKAIEAMELLSDLLRYQLYDINTKVSIEQEINYLQTYIQFQQLRMTERLQFEQSFSLDLKEQKIHPLLFQPLLENAFKYVGGDYRIWMKIRKEGAKVRFCIRNTVPSDNTDKKNGTGIGIGNLKERLKLLYPDKYTLQIEQDDTYFTVNLLIDLSE